MTAKKHHFRTVNQMSPGDRGVVRDITRHHPRLRRRLLEMGLVKGSSVQFVRSAPLGDPVEITVKGYRLSLRRTEAELVVLELEKRND